MKLLCGREIAGYIKERQAHEVRALRQAHKVFPKLAIVVTVDNPVIDVYMRMKKKYGADILIDVDVHKIAQKSAPETIKKLNEDEAVHGIIVQLPLENPDETEEIVNLVAPEKDVDALGNPDAPWPPMGSDMQGADEQRTVAVQNSTAKGAAESATQQSAGQRGSWFDPATPMAILWLLAGYDIELSGKKILLVGRGKLVGAPLEKILTISKYDISVADRNTKNLADKTLEADVIITATGSPAILYPDMIKQGAVVVDAGVASESGKTVGDVAPEAYDRDDLSITPTKGGVGPLTVCALFENVIHAAARMAEAKE
jgi:methylenetetrahydrofolate dehydrogenase (NADP+)/methenyltetrahydrofolate cyclohydrolase